MAKSILLNDNFEEDIVFPKKLANLAKLAYVAAAKSEKTFIDPDSNVEYTVEDFNVYDFSTRRMEQVVGVSVVHENLLWQCWHAGITVKSREYFRFRAYNMVIARLDARGGIIDEPLTIATGTIFQNVDRTGEHYNMQLTDTALSAEIKLARNLMAAGVSIEQILNASDSLTRSDIEPTVYTRGGRTSGVVLG